MNINGKHQSDWNNAEHAQIRAVKNSSGFLTVLHITNETNLIAYLWLYNAAAADVVLNTTPPYAVFTVGGSAYDTHIFNELPEFDTGISYTVSSSPTMVTSISGSSTIQVQLFYR